MDRAERHIGLAGPALGNDSRCLGLAEVLRGAGDGERLGRQRLTQKRCNARRNRVFRALKRRIGFENARSKFDRVSAQIIEGGLHGDTSWILGWWLCRQELQNMREATEHTQ